MTVNDLMIDQEITLGAAIGYSSGKNSSSLKTPPVQQTSKRSYVKRNMIRFHSNVKTSYLQPYLHAT